jgi:PAS domain S-box-containing protein
MAIDSDEEKRVRAAALQNATAILHARQESEREVAAERERLRITLASIGDAVISTDAEGRVTFLNGAAEHLTGWPLADAAGRPLEEVFRIVNERSRRVVENPALRALREGVVVGLANHTVLLARDGTERPIDDSAAPIRDLAGVIVGAVLVFRDVTEKRRAEEARARLAAIVETSEDAIVSKTLDGIIRTWNAGAERIFGYSAEEAVGQPITLIIPPDRLSEEHEIISRLRRGERIAHFETVRVAKGGRLANISLAVSPLRDSEGEVVGASKVARDITAAKAAEAALREENLLVETLNSIGRRLTAELNLQKLLQAVTDETTSLTGAAFGAFFYNATDAQGDSYMLYTLAGAPREAFADFPQPRATAIFAPTFRGDPPVRLDDVTKDPRYGLSAPYYGKPAGHLPVRSYLAVSVRARSGEVLGGLFFGHPEVGRFTARHERLVVGVAAQAAVAIDNARLYERIREQDKRKDDFLAVLAHELRNPLAPLRNGLRVVRLSEDRETRETAQDMMGRQIENLVRLVDDLLDVSRINQDKMELRRARVSLAEVVTTAVETARPTIDAAGHELIVDLPTEPVILDADLTRLAQVLSNLLTNSGKYTDPGGRIWLTARTEADTVIITVRDTGIGIASAALPTLFEMFSQVDWRGERAAGGLGIGLALVKGLVEMHGGTVTASSPGAGQGSTFTVTLPLPEVVADAEPTSAPGDQRGVRKRRRVLVVDDSRDGAQSMAMMLELFGDEVRSAFDGLQAVTAAEEFRPEVILMDVGMPKMNGYDATRKIREAPWGKAMAIIALTGWGQDVDRVRSREAGCDGHLVKPVVLEDLEKLLAEIKSRRSGPR